jgi:anthranilate synthase/indole-3-glycerol phosphate synthase/phosphoribosylanthranilate isomerase
LLDAGAGGTGQRVDLRAVMALFERDPGVKVQFAGGLTSENVQDVLQSLGSYRSNIAGVDVSSGVETDGKQDLEKIVAFIKAVKGFQG